MTENIASLPPKPVAAATATTGTSGQTKSRAAGDSFWGGSDGPSFGDLLDIVNPLQHIPIVSTIYRAITGDKIDTGSQVVGGLLYGGPIGMIASGFNALFDEASGGSVETHIASLIDDITGGSDQPTAVASNTTPATASTDQQQAAIAADTAAPTLQLGNPAANTLLADARPFPTALRGGAAASDPAALMNRIAYRPGAPLGVPISAAGSDRPHVFPAHPTTQRVFPIGNARQAAPAETISANAANAANGAPSAVGGDAESQRILAAAAQARRMQTDSLLAKWAERQMQMQGQTAKAESPERNDGRKPAEVKAAAEADLQAAHHPMLPPKDATPEWYANAMKSALSRYQAAQQTGAIPPVPQTANP